MSSLEKEVKEESKDDRYPNQHTASTQINQGSRNVRDDLLFESNQLLYQIERVYESTEAGNGHTKES